MPDRVTQVVDERKKAEKRVTDTEQELAEYIAKGLATEIVNKNQANEIYKHHIHRTDDTGNALGFLTSIAFSLGSVIPSSMDGARPYVVILSSTPSTQTTTTISTVLVVGTDDAKVKVVGDALKMKLAVKGGGKGTRWSGKFTGVWKETRESASIEEILSALI